VKLKESVVMGQTVRAYDKYCRGSKDYQALAKELIYLCKQEQGDNEELSGQDSSNRNNNMLNGKQVQPLSSRMQELVMNETRALFQNKFILNYPDAKSVYVTGSFNDWSLDDTCRLKEVNGQWETTISLKPGLYKYQFIVDGVWMEDPSNPRKERNSFGDVNSLLEVETA